MRIPAPVCAMLLINSTFFWRSANFSGDTPWAMLFPNAPDGGALPRHPSQLYEAGLEGLVLFIFLWVLTYRYQRLATPAFISGAFAFGYGIARTFSETSDGPLKSRPCAVCPWHFAQLVSNSF